MPALVHSAVIIASKATVNPALLTRQSTVAARLLLGRCRKDIGAAEV